MDLCARPLTLIRSLMLFATFLVTGPAFGQAPTADQARCLNDLNKLGWTVSQKQGKAALSCVGAAAAGRTTQLGKPGQTLTAQACLTNDVKSTVAKAEQKLADADARRCLASPGQMPPFGYVGSGPLGASAKAEPLGIVGDLFGADLDAALVRTTENRKGAACQAFVLKQANKLYDAVWKTILARKKEVLRCSQATRPASCVVRNVPAVASASELAAELLAGVDADAKSLIGRAAGALASGASAQCGASTGSLGTLFPGACAGSATVAELTQCAEQVVRARSCRALNAFDGLGAQCPPLPGRVPVIEAPSSVDFGLVPEGASVEQVLTIENRGEADLLVSAIDVSGAAFALVENVAALVPSVVPPGSGRSVALRVLPVLGSGAGTVAGEVVITSDDPGDPQRHVFLTAEVVPATSPPVSNPVAGAILRAAGIDGQITGASCGSVEVRISLTSDAAASDGLSVSLVDGTGEETAALPVAGLEGAGTVVASGIDACALADGIVAPSIVVTRGATVLPPLRGAEGVKNTSSLAPPVLETDDTATFASTVEVCGTSRANTTVTITGGATASVSKAITADDLHFCLVVPLRPRQENVLVVSAVDDLAAAPRPQAYAAPIRAFQLDIADIVAVETSSKLLSPEETIALAESGHIDLDDPANYNVSEFRVSFTVGDRVLSATRLVVTPKTPSPGTPTVSFGVPLPMTGGGGGGGGGVAGETPVARSGWSGSSEGPTVILPPPPSAGGCTTACMQFVAIRTPTGQTVPGVILIDGRIKTLKEFFQVSIAITNTSSSPALRLEQVGARVVLPGGLTPIRAGVGGDLATLNLDGAVDAATIGTIEPGETGRAQFLVRGDQIGTHVVDVAFDGFVTGALLSEPFPFSGASATSVDVLGPPELAVVLRHPSDANGPDVTLNQIYPLVLEITNLSNRPALYTSVDLFVGGGARLVGDDDQPLDESLASRAVGHVLPGQTVTLAYRVQSLIQGDIIACQGIASANIRLSIDTGPDGASCGVAGMVRSGGVPLPPDLPPIVLGFTPTNGASTSNLSTDVLVALTPQAACLVPDSFGSVVTERIVPGDPGSALRVVRASLVAPGTYRLEELDAFGRPVAAVPVDLTTLDPPSGGTTTASLRLGLASPLSQAFLKPDTLYRATLVGGAGGVCSAASGAVMESSFRWVFGTGAACPGTEPTVVLLVPADGATERPIDQPIELEFSEPIALPTLTTTPGNLAASSFAVIAGGVVSGGDVTGGAMVAGSAVVDHTGRKLTFTAAAPLPPQTLVSVRLTSALTSPCGTALSTPSNGVKLFSFTTAEPDTAPPSPPVVNAVPQSTSLVFLQVTGTAEASAVVTITGGSSVATGAAGTSGLFSVSVPLTADAVNTLSATARDASRNVSTPTTTDAQGASLQVRQDSTPPSVTSIVPANGAEGIPASSTVVVTFDEPILQASASTANFRVLNGSTPVDGSVGASGDTLTFTPTAPLPAPAILTVRLRAGGVRDAVGNPLADEVVATFTTSGGPPVVTAITPPSGLQGVIVPAQILGSNLAGVTSVTIDGTGVTVTDLGTGSATSRDVRFAIDATAPLGARNVTVTTPSGSASGTFTVVESPADATIEWIAPAGGDWNVAANWDENRVPNAADDVRISSTLGPVTFTGTVSVRSLTLFAELQVSSGSLTIGNGSVSPAVVVHVNGDLEVRPGGTVVVQGGMTLNGTVTLESNSTSSPARVHLAGSQVIDGSGEVVFDGTAVAASFVEPTSGTTTIGAGVTVRGGFGTLGGTSGTLGFLGTIEPDVTAEVIRLAGAIDNGGASMTVAPGPGVFALGGGTIRNAAVLGGGSIDAGSNLQANSGTLEAVVLDANVRVRPGGTVVVQGGMTLNGTVTLESNSTSSPARVHLAGSQVIDGSGEVVFDGTAVAASFVEPTSGTTTIGAGVTVRGGFGTIGGAGGTVDLRGTVRADANGGAIAVVGNFENRGTVGAAAGGELRLTVPTSAGGTIRAAAGGNVVAPSGLVLGSSDTLAVEIAGTSTSQFGRVTVTGAASIAGALAIEVDAGFSPALGQRFRFMSFGSRSGLFGSITGDDLGGGLSLDLDASDATDLELVVAP